MLSRHDVQARDGNPRLRALQLSRARQRQARSATRAGDAVMVLLLLGGLSVFVLMQTPARGVIVTVAPLCVAAAAAVAVGYLTHVLTAGPDPQEGLPLQQKLIEASPEVTLVRRPAGLLTALLVSVAATLAALTASLGLSVWMWSAAGAAAACSVVLVNRLLHLPVLTMSPQGFVLTQADKVLAGMAWTDCTRFSRNPFGDIQVSLSRHAGGSGRTPLPYLNRFSQGSPDNLVRLLNSFLDRGGPHTD